MPPCLPTGDRQWCLVFNSIVRNTEFLKRKGTSKSPSQWGQVNQPRGLTAAPTPSPLAQRCVARVVTPRPGATSAVAPYPVPLLPAPPPLLLSPQLYKVRTRHLCSRNLPGPKSPQSEAAAARHAPQSPCAPRSLAGPPANGAGAAAPHLPRPTCPAGGSKCPRCSLAVAGAVP